MNAPPPQNQQSETSYLQKREIYTQMRQNDLRVTTLQFSTRMTDIFSKLLSLPITQTDETVTEQIEMHAEICLLMHQFWQENDGKHVQMLGALNDGIKEQIGDLDEICTELKNKLETLYERRSMLLAIHTIIPEAQKITNIQLRGVITQITNTYETFLLLRDKDYPPGYQYQNVYEKLSKDTIKQWCLLFEDKRKTHQGYLYQLIPLELRNYYMINKEMFTTIERSKATNVLTNLNSSTTEIQNEPNPKTAPTANVPCLPKYSSSNSSSSGIKHDDIEKNLDTEFNQAQGKKEEDKTEKPKDFFEIDLSSDDDKEKRNTENPKDSDNEEEEIEKEQQGSNEAEKDKTDEGKEKGKGKVTKGSKEKLKLGNAKKGK